MKITNTSTLSGTTGLKAFYYISDLKWLSLDPEVLANYRPQANLL